MEQGLGQDSIPATGSFDKSRVLNVKPLRCLVPIFPSSQPNQTSFSSPQAAAPFVCVPPAGPFPPGVSPFYPFSVPTESQTLPEQNPQTPFGVPNQGGSFGFTSPIQAAVPISSFRTPQPPQHAGAPGKYSGSANGDTGSSRKWSTSRNPHARATYVEEDDYSDSQNQSAQFMSGSSMEDDAEETSKKGKRRGKYRKKAKRGQDVKFPSPVVDLDSIVNNLLTSFNHMIFDPFRQADGDKEAVGCVLMAYNLLRKKITQIDESREATPGVTRRADLRAGTLLMTKGIRTNSKKRTGAVPGVEVGDIFFFRMETCLVGLHAPSMAGIDYMKINKEEDPLAVSIVSSGGYEDNAEDGDVLIYSGQGGNVQSRDKEVIDQKLVRGNLALEKSVHRGNDVRVIRGIKDPGSLTGKVYVYDGLYKIQESWVENKSGCNMFKYKFVRVSGQPEAFTIWKSIQQWKEGIISRDGVILPDLTSGAESLPVSLVNDVDDEKGPAYFTYLPRLKYSAPVSSMQSSFFCTCQAGCVSGDPHCSCVQRNGGYLPYLANGVLVNQESLIHECGPSCSCPPNCRNRSTQGGPKVRLEVFKTKDKGWGLRSWDPIRAGAFICEYAGEVIDTSKVDEFGSNEDEYIFDSNRTYQPLEVMPGDSNEAPKIPFPLTISAKNCGNVARFMNHSCSPNVLWQPILRADKNENSLHVAFFAIGHIPPMRELAYDYGIAQTENANQRRKRCKCGSSKCRGYFF